MQNAERKVCDRTEIVQIAIKERMHFNLNWSVLFALIYELFRRKIATGAHDDIFRATIFRL